jgi:hypothetical protein
LRKFWGFYLKFFGGLDEGIFENLNYEDCSMLFFGGLCLCYFFNGSFKYGVEFNGQFPILSGFSVKKLVILAQPGATCGPLSCLVWPFKSL